MTFGKPLAKGKENGAAETMAGRHESPNMETDARKETIVIIIWEFGWVEM